jgi:hypothetical protein
MTTRASSSDPWEAPVNLGPTVNGPDSDRSADISADGLTLFFDSDRPGGSGNWDLWMSARASIFDPWEPPVNLGPTVSTSSAEAAPSISADGLTLFFESNRPGGSGGWDLWMSARASVSDPWEPPVNLGPMVNTPSSDGTSDISADGRTLFFRSDRPGGQGGIDLWQVAVTPTCPADVNDDDTVDVNDLFAIINAWGPCDDCAEDINDDGLVNVDDLFELINNWGPCV